MENEFFNASNGGDPALFQHILWFFGHPSSWVLLAKWLLLLTGAYVVARRLAKARRFGWLALFLAVFAACWLGVRRLLKQTHQLIIEGRMDEVTLWPLINRGLSVLAAVILVWFIYLIWKRRQ